MPKTDHGNPDLIRQHKQKGEMGDRALADKPGKSAPTKSAPSKSAAPKSSANDRTPPRKGDPEQAENVPGREEKRSRKPDANETYRTGRQGRS
jgi:hypothetical protein